MKLAPKLALLLIGGAVFLAVTARPADARHYPGTRLVTLRSTPCGGTRVVAYPHVIAPRTPIIRTPRFRRVYRRGFRDGFDRGYGRGFEDGYREGFRDGAVYEATTYRPVTVYRPQPVVHTGGVVYIRW